MNPYGSKLLLTLFAREIEFINDYNEIKNPNQIYLCGFICKKPVYRRRPSDEKLPICCLAINRTYNNPITYVYRMGEKRPYSRRLKVGDNIRIWGRIQSRDYQKKYDDGTVENKTAYEVSVTKMEIPNINNMEERQEIQEIEDDDNNNQDQVLS